MILELFSVIVYVFIITTMGIIVNAAIVARRNTKQQTKLQQEMKSLLREMKGLLQNIADGEGTDDVV